MSLHLIRPPFSDLRRLCAEANRSGMHLVLYEPDIPQNAGTLFRLAACLGVKIDVIEPCGFVLDDARLKRAAMDYYQFLDLRRHGSWADYRTFQQASTSRLILLTTQATVRYADFTFRPTDHLLLGRESAGVPQAVHAAADARILVPLRAGLRSLNVAVSAAMVLGEALRQTQGFPS